MTDKEQIEEMARELFNIKTQVYSPFTNKYDGKDKFFAIAEELAKQGYHKTLWHKVKDNILPPINTCVRCVLNWCGVLYYATGWYNTKGYWDFSDNLNPDAELIAWAYMPEYKE